MLRIHDSRTGTAEEIAAGRALRTYACGTAVTGRPDGRSGPGGVAGGFPGGRPDGRPGLGELRSLLLADLIRRILERGRVRVVACSPRGSGEAGAQALRDAAALNCRPAEHAPSVAETIPYVVELVGALVEKGHAYVAPEGPVFFDAGSFPGLPPLPAGERSEGGRSPADWVLWLPSGGEPSWDSPWGRGVPGPHVVCSAVALGLLGGRVDVHVGGAGPRRPYEDRERAQSDAAAGREVARHRVQAADVRFDDREPGGHAREGEAPPPDTGDAGDGGVSLAEVVGAGLDPLAVRMAFLEHHYRRPIVLTWDSLRAADRAVRHWRTLVAEWSESPSAPMAAEYVKRVETAFDDDLDTPGALRALRELADDASVPPGTKFESFLHVDQVLGLDLSSDIGKSR
ncbi:cysteine--tRNA ligase [Nonomuraea sp. 3-1Str]|uniref:cysteine--tRNA ligase n=1 Tax=Nonomuraea sp. 3-1Str TaxID=2929801 RepID=UPI00285DD9D9|nr:cysteine--tRNA ligase [Nonomuraea sp. 3-1Str]MDR8412660.1 cysteine--tRNA ligase [Nonomuraea sp. 3-1Str]